MAGILPTDENDSDRLVLGLLTWLEADGAQSQRRIAAELGVALGLVNAYLKRAIKKGFVKVGQAPARRYAYYLTPQGFAEKSRLTVDYMSHSFSLFRRARARYGPFKLAILPIGAYEPRWFMADQHMNPAESVQAFIDCGAELALAEALRAAGLTAEQFGALRRGQVWQA